MGMTRRVGVYVRQLNSCILDWMRFYCLNVAVTRLIIKPVEYTDLSSRESLISVVVFGRR